MTAKPSFTELRRQLAEERNRKAPINEPKPKTRLRSVPDVDEDLIPDVLGDRSEENIEIDGIIDRIDVLEAYRKWIGKEVDEATTDRREGVMVSCPNPDHRDKNPSAWINTDSRTWFCGGCQEGGDVFDLAAIKFGYPRPEYKTGKEFADLRRDIAEDYGYRVKVVSGTEVVWKDEPKPESKPDPKAKKSAPKPEREIDPDDEPVASITTLREEDVEDEPEEEIVYPVIKWRTLVPEGTFLYDYMEATTNDDSPEEYHFWHGLLGLAHAVGRNAYLDDTKVVYANLLVCLLGGTGFGKSRSRGWLEEVLEEAVPFQDNGLDTSGCKQIPVPASGENLIYQFQHIGNDPSAPKGSGARTSVNGIVDYDEFAGLLARAMRSGSTLKVYIQQFSDSRKRISSSSNTGGLHEAYEPFCSITASTQPKAVRELLSKYDAGSGFLNRWIFVGGERKKRESIGGKRSSIQVNLDDAIASLKKVRAWAAPGREIELDDAAFEEWEKFFHGVIEPMTINDDTDLLSRLPLTMKRLMLLFAINERRRVVTVEDVRRLEPLCEYLLRCYSILNAEIGVSALSEVTTEILRHIGRIEEKTNRGASARDLSLRLKRRNYSPDMIRKALETLVALDWIEVQKVKGPGRPTVRYGLVN